MFRMEIETGNAAFQEWPGQELAQMLTDLAEKVRQGLDYAPDADQSGHLRDSNGATVGMWSYTAE